MYVRSLFALICSAVIGSATALSLDFNPAKFIIDDTSAGKGFGCKLNEKPTSPVTIYLEHTSIYFSDCILVFTPENWDILQTINATAVPVFGSYMGAGGIADIASSINAHMVQEGQTTEIPKVEYGCDRKPAAGGTCTSIGDPHYQTFDSLTFSSQVIGHYYLLKSDDFEIQVITHSCGPNVSCTAAIAIRYGSTLMVLDVRQKKDPSQYTVQQVTPNTNGVVYIPPPTGSGVHKINTPCGSSISAVSNLDRGFNNIDITINLAGRYSKIGGLCNVLSSQTKKGLIYSSGKIGNPTSTQDVSGFVDSWVVKSGDSLFEGNYKGSTPPVNTPGKICKLPTIPKPVPAPPAPSVPPTLPVYVPPPPPPAPASTAAASTAPASTAAASTAAASTIVLSSTSLPGSTATSAPSPQATVPAPPPVFDQEIEKHCRDMFNVPSCNTIIPVDFFVQSCIKDAQSTGSYIFIEGSKRAYLARCAALSVYMENGPTPVIVEQGKKVQEDCGFGNRTCLNNCSGNGVCSNVGCACKTGFAGQDCSMDLSKVTQYDPNAGKYQVNVNVNVIIKYQQEHINQTPQLPAPAPQAPQPSTPQTPATAPPASDPQTPAPASDPQTPAPASGGEQPLPVSTPVGLPQSKPAESFPNSVNQDPVLSSAQSIGSFVALSLAAVASTMFVLI
ncbi:hypothetical protein MT418_003783 [Batrachochytrium dendrobatidis]